MRLIIKIGVSNLRLVDYINNLMNPSVGIEILELLVRLVTFILLRNQRKNKRKEIDTYLPTFHKLLAKIEDLTGPTCRRMILCRISIVNNTSLYIISGNYTV